VGSIPGTVAKIGNKLAQTLGGADPTILLVKGIIPDTVAKIGNKLAQTLEEC
jgi:hypothetical protein